MTTREATTLTRKEQLISEYWTKYCETKSPWFYRQWTDAKKSFRNYRDELRQRYEGQQKAITF